MAVLASLLIFLNPVMALFFSAAPASLPEVTPTTTPLAGEFRLPLNNFAFLAAQFLPGYPFRDWNTPEPEISAKTALVFDASRQRLLWQKNGLDEPKPIASLTKLLTALAVLQIAGPDEIFMVSQTAIATSGEMGDLIVGEQLTVKNLLAAMLIASSNDAAIALAENISERYQKNLVDKMNDLARELNLKNSFFVDPSGLEARNLSSANDMIILFQEVLKNPLLASLVQASSWETQSVDKRFSHRFISTNQLLTQMPEIIGGKTGYTEEAGNCMIIASKAPDQQGNIVMLVMESQDRMAEISVLIKWTEDAFLW